MQREDPFYQIQSNALNSSLRVERYSQTGTQNRDFAHLALYSVWHYVTIKIAFYSKLLKNKNALLIDLLTDAFLFIFCTFVMYGK